MSSGAIEDNPAVQPVTVAPLEDAGAETQHRYQWQHHCTAIDALAMIATNDGITRIVCEFHEDYVVERGLAYELVSCKHREPPKGPFSLVELCHDGGIAHLMSRWKATAAGRVRLMTNGALKSGPLEARTVIDACRKLQESGTVTTETIECRDALTQALLAAGRRKTYQHVPVTERPPKRNIPTVVPSGFDDIVLQFMNCLVVRDELPPRNYIRGQNVESAARPALETKGLSANNPADCYDAIVNIIAQKNAATALSGHYLELITSTTSTQDRANLNALISVRTIMPTEVLQALGRRRQQTLLRRYSATRDERLRVKLVAGGIKSTRRNSAARLREAWLAAWAELRTGLPGDAHELADLEARVLEVAGDIEAEVATPDERWGDKMYTRLKDELQSGNLVRNTALPVTGSHLLGLALALTADCQIWFSDEFDVDAALASTTPNPAEHSGEDK